MQEHLLKFWATLTPVQRTVIATLLDAASYFIRGDELIEEKDVLEQLSVTEKAAQGDVNVLPRRDRHNLNCLLERNEGISVAGVIRHYRREIEHNKAVLARGQR